MQLLFPLPHFAQDIYALNGQSRVNTTQALAPLLLSLPEVEKKHRKTLLPIVTAFISAHSNPSDIASSIIDEAFQASGTESDEREAVRIAMELRLGSRMMSEGGVIKAKQLNDELEKRECVADH